MNDLVSDYARSALTRSLDSLAQRVLHVNVVIIPKVAHETFGGFPKLQILNEFLSLR